jgi:two-component system NtrC family sensor kinase
LKLLTSARQTHIPEADYAGVEKNKTSVDLNNLTMYREIFTSSRGAFLVFDARGKFYDISVKAEEIIGYTRAEIIGKSALSVARLLTRKGPLLWLSNPLSRVTNNQETIREIDVYTKAGERVTLKLNARFLRHQGTIVGRLVEVSVRNQSQTEIGPANDKEEVYRSLVKHMEIGIFRTTPGITGRFLEVNPAMEKITGYSREELLQMNVCNLYVHPEERAEIIKQVLAGELKEPKEILYKKKDGREIVVRDKKVAVTAADGNTVYFEGFLEDITERKQTEEALKLERENFRNSTEMSPLGVEIIAYEGELIYVNRTMLGLWGYQSFAELINVPLERRFTVESVARIHELNEMHRQGKALSKYEVTILCKNGQQRVLTAYNKEIIWNGKKCTEIFYEDITERKQSEEALWESERKYSLIASSTVDYIAIMTLQGNYVYLSPSHKQLGYEPEELVGRSGMDLIHPEDKRRLLPLLVKYTNMKLKELLGLKAESFSQTISYRIRDKQDNWHYMECNASTIESSDGKNINILLVSRDLTEKKQAEEALRKQKELIDRTLMATPNAVLVVDKDLRILLENKTFEAELTGGKSVEGQVMSEIVISEVVIEAVKAVVSGKDKKQKVEFRTKTENNDKTYVATVINMEEGQALLVLADITSEREKEDKTYLRERLATVGEMASGIAHELNNPLTSVIGLAELLEEKELPADVGEDIKVICQEARRASQIVKNLLSFARKHEPTRQPSRIADVINDVLKLRAYEQKVNNIAVTTNIQSDLPDIMVDYYQIQQVFLNIILNAEQAMIEAHGQGELIVTVERCGDNIRTAFTDNGPGISPENMKRVFDPFYTTKEVGKGTGLGLSISYGIVNSHRGKIHAESKYGKGSTFIVELPTQSE